MEPTRLIVNGDDLGRSESVTRGVALAHERGILTSTSIVAGGPCFDLAIEIAEQHPGLGVGVHLAIDEYPPVADPREIPSLVRPDGQFYPRAAGLARILLGRTRLDDLRREWTGQIRKAAEAGVRITHLDGHGHCHSSPSLAGLVVELAASFDISAVRLPMEPLTHRGNAFSSRRYLEKTLLNSACRLVRSRWNGHIGFPDACYGFMEGGRLDVPSLEAIAAKLQPGVSELFAHPGTSNDDAPYHLAYDWRGDLDALLAYTRPEFEERFGVELVSYRDVWEPC